jgi:hypothetical protein
MNKDTLLLQEAYTNILEKKDSKKTSKKPDKDKDGIPDWADKEDNSVKAKKKTSRFSKKDELEEAYQEILESKHINKKFARRYNRVTADLLKADPGSKNYMKLKNERDDLISILKDHGKTPADLDELLTKKEIEEIKNDEISDQKQNDLCTQCGDGGHNKNNCPENC